MGNTPLSMVLEKQIECFVDLKSRGLTIPSFIYKPGKIFPVTKTLNKHSKRIYAPYGLLSSTAGARSTFMLPNIGCTTNHVLLRRDFKIKASAPKNLYDHWHVFKEIVDSQVMETDWRCCVMYFSEKWIKSLNENKSWSCLKQYLHEIAWHQCSYEINRVYYDMIFSIIQDNRNLKPNPYLTDTAKHLFAIAAGAAPGYIPAVDNEALPLDIIQHAFVQSYGLKKYIPTILHPAHYDFEQDNYPIYYSLQNPSTSVFSPKSREISSTLSEMRELEHIVNIFSSELAKDNGMCAVGSIMNKIAKQVKFSYYHNKSDSHNIIRSSSDLLELDERFISGHKSLKATFASDAPFVRGCIRVGS